MKKIFVSLTLLLFASTLPAAPKLPGNVEDWKSIAHFHGQNVTASLLHKGTPTLSLNAGNIRLGGIIVQLKNKALPGELRRDSERMRTYTFDGIPNAELRFELTQENFIHGVLTIPADTPLQLHFSLLRGQLGDKVLADGKELPLTDTQTQTLQNVKEIVFFPGDAKRSFTLQIPEGTRATLTSMPAQYGFSVKLVPEKDKANTQFTLIPGKISTR